MDSSRTRTSGLRLAALVAMLAMPVLAFAAPAAAQSTASMSGTTVQLVADAANDNIAFGGNWGLQQYITDSTGILAGVGCEQVDSTKVRCPSSNSSFDNYTGLVAHLGAGDDTLMAGMVSVPITVYGEDGNDTVYGGSAADILDGGPGNDELDGNGGSDRIDGGPGNDTLYAGGGDTTLTGGPGRDSIHTGGHNELAGGNSTVLAQDGEQDQISCSVWGADSVYADSIDVVSGCANVRRGTTPPPQPRAMRIALSGLPAHPTITAVLKSGYRFNCSFSTDGKVSAALAISAQQARQLRLPRKLTMLATVVGTVTSGKYRVTLHVKNTPYRKALSRAKRVAAILSVVAMDKAGRVATASRKVTLTK
jgi:RTX calcium-binding nonapeptide repeat (4 copies)